MEMHVKAVRGAISVDADVPDLIVEAGRELTERILHDNAIDIDWIVSALYTSTSDLTSEFPAVGARKAGLVDTPLICAQEIPVTGSLPRLVRVLMHVSVPVGHQVKPVYLKEAVKLRPDLVSPTQSEETVDEEEATAPEPRKAILRIEPYVPGKSATDLQKNGVAAPTVKLSSNENPLGPPASAMEAARAELQSLHLYPDGASRNIKAEIAAYHGVIEDEVIMGAGSDEVIRLIGEAYLEPGEAAVFADVTFSQYAFVTRLMGAEEVVVPLKDGVHDLGAMADAVWRTNAKVCFVCNPNNPTGTYVDRARLEAFLDRLPPSTVAVVDEAYVEYAQAKDFPDAVSLFKQGRSLISLRTFSKVYGLAGLRVGYGIASRDVVSLLERIRPPFNINRMAQAAAVAALHDNDHLATSRFVNDEQRRRLTEAFIRMGLKPLPSEANFIWVDMGRAGTPIYEGLMEAGVIVRDGAAFGEPTCLRVTVGTEPQNDRLLEVLQSLL